MAVRLAIVDYGTGNLGSIANAITHIGGKSVFVNKPENLYKFDRILLPGVGSFRRAMKQMRSLGFDDVLRELVYSRQIPILGICLGMQLMARRSSENGESEGLGIIDCEVDRFCFDRTKQKDLKVPHVGFNTVLPRSDSLLFSGLGEEVDFYFTHSYRLQCSETGLVAAKCWHGEDFVAAIERGHVAATQFHPEKSQANGLKLLKNFLSKF